MSKPIVWMVHISHKHGDDVNVFDTEQDAEDFLADYCRGYWTEDGTDTKDNPDSLSNKEVIDRYFGESSGRGNERECYDMRSAEVHGVSKDVPESSKKSIEDMQRAMRQGVHTLLDALDDLFDRDTRWLTEHFAGYAEVAHNSNYQPKVIGAALDPEDERTTT